MKTPAIGFSEQYLKQVHEEWLYAQTIRLSQSAVGVSSDADAGEFKYSFCALPRSDADWPRQTG